MSRIAPRDRGAQRVEDARRLPRIRLTPEQETEVRNLANGTYSPLEGFPGRADYEACLREGRLASGLPWTVPVVLDSEPTGARPGEEIALVGERGGLLAVLAFEEAFPLDRAEHARRVLGTASADHPGVKRLAQARSTLLSGRIELLVDGPGVFPGAAPPAEVRAIVRSRGWRTVCGYQTRNAPHRAHELVHKVGLSIADGLLVHPVVGRKRPGDFRDEVVLDGYRALLAERYPTDRVLLAALPLEMRYAGPREAIHHAILRQNFGCTHFLVGRDHAGAGGFYAPEAAIEAFERYPDLAIRAIPVRGSHAWCLACGGIESERTCRHAPEGKLAFSGTLVREAFAQGRTPPPEVMRPEVVAAIRKHDRPFVE